MLVEWLRKAPTAVVVTVIVMSGVIVLGVLTMLTTLTLMGADTAELRQWIQTIGVTVIVPLLGLNTLGTVVAAKSAAAAEDQTNGHLAAKDTELSALRRQVAALEDRKAGK